MLISTRNLSLFWGLAIAGCTGIAVIDSTSPASIRAEVEAGDRILLTTQAQAFYELTVVELTDTAIEGRDDGGELVTIPYADVARVSLSKRQPGKTAAAIGRGVGTAVIALAALVGYAVAVAY